ncbi:hypothetical protein ACFQL4_14785 [Halosimplex aquaticum]
MARRVGLPQRFHAPDLPSGHGTSRHRRPVAQCCPRRRPPRTVRAARHQRRGPQSVSDPARRGVPSGLHTHADQEEIFLVVDGTATFETLPESDPPSDPADPPRTGREVTVDAGEAVRFAPGEYQSGYNRGETDLLAFAVGAPRESTDVRVPVRCPECGGADLGWTPAATRCRSSVPTAAPNGSRRPARSVAPIR